MTGAFVDEKNLENPLLDCDSEASNNNQDQEDETEDRIYRDDKVVNEEIYKNSENLGTENNDNDGIDNNDSMSTIVANDKQVVDHNAAYMEPEIEVFLCSLRELKKIGLLTIQIP